MSNNINSLSPIENNALASKKLSEKNSGIKITVPDRLPSYSLDNYLKDQDEFRKSIHTNSSSYKKKNNVGYFLKLSALTALVLSAFHFFEKKKLIK